MYLLITITIALNAIYKEQTTANLCDSDYATAIMQFGLTTLEADTSIRPGPKEGTNFFNGVCVAWLYFKWVMYIYNESHHRHIQLFTTVRCRLSRPIGSHFVVWAKYWLSIVSFKSGSSSRSTAVIEVLYGISWYRDRVITAPDGAMYVCKMINGSANIL